MEGCFERGGSLPELGSDSGSEFPFVRSKQLFGILGGKNKPLLVNSEVRHDTTVFRIPFFFQTRTITRFFTVSSMW